ncbi:MAG: RNB domain-containing ribonuclease, partial [Polynucleobacter victoriensis]
RVEQIPLRLSVPELAEQPRGARAEVEVLEIDFLALEASVRYLGLLHPAELEEDEMDDEITEQPVNQAVIAEEVADDVKPTPNQ